jgi:hypothetical protein
MYNFTLDVSSVTPNVDPSSPMSKCHRRRNTDLKSDQRLVLENTPYVHSRIAKVRSMVDRRSNNIKARWGEPTHAYSFPIPDISSGPPAWWFSWSRQRRPGTLIGPSRKHAILYNPEVAIAKIVVNCSALVNRREIVRERILTCLLAHYLLSNQLIWWQPCISQPPSIRGWLCTPISVSSPLPVARSPLDHIKRT